MKNNARSFYLFVLVLLCNFGIVFSQELYFNQVTPPPESPSWGLTTSMMQDRSGYMWFTTNNLGVQRFDGYEYKSYVNEPHNSNSLAINTTECIMEDSEGIIWIGTTGAGLERLDPVSGKFTHFVHDPNDPESIIHNDVKAIFEDHEGVLWIGTRTGLEIFDRETQKFKHFVSDTNDPTSLSYNCVKNIYEDSDNVLWFGSGETWGGDDLKSGGLNRYDRKTGKFTRFVHDENDSSSLVDNRITAIYEDSQGNFWIGTAEDGLHLMDREKGTFQRFTHDPLDPEKLSRPALQSLPFPDAVDHISFINEDAMGNIWIGTMGAGINRYDPDTQKVTHYGGDQSDGGLKDMLFWSSFTSRDGVVWVSTVENNLFRVNPSQTRITDVNTGTFAVNFFQDHTDIIWLGGLNGLIRRDLVSGLNTEYVHDSLNPLSISQGVVRGIVSDEVKGLWVATFGGGLNYFDLATESFTHYNHDESDTRTIDNDTITVLYKDKSSNIWLGTRTGLNVMKHGSKHFVRYQHDSLDSNSLSDSNAVVSILEDKDQKYLWVGTLGGGLNRLNISTGSFDHFLPKEFVYCVVQDQTGVIWASSDKGLSSYQSDQNLFEKYMDPNGVFNFEGFEIKVDNLNNIWFLRQSGIGKLNSDRSLVQYYSKSNGANMARNYSFRVFKDINGAMCFPYFPDGYSRIEPDNLIRESDPPLILIKDFKLGLESILPGEGEILDTPINEETEINLSHDQNIFSFDFVAVDYTSPEDNMLFFKLENYDKDWRDPGMEKSVQYINIPPGDYVFRVKAATNMGVFTEREIIINISPPWWQTWWAYGMYICIFVVGVISVHRFQKARLLKAERERARDKELAQAREIEKAYTKLKGTQAQLIQSEKMASLGELTAGIAHEIQNPLNFVNNFSEVNAELIEEMREELENGNLEDVKSIANDIVENEQKIIQHGKRADAIVKGMLQHSRSNSGQKELTDINALTDEFLRLSYHGLRAKDKSFNAKMETDFDTSLGKVNIVAQDIGRVILNLINNAFYAVNDRKSQDVEGYEPTVIAKTKRFGHHLEISIKDNGKGIPSEIKDKIFQPFFTSKPTGKGTGLGLSLSYDIVKAHGGEIALESKEGVGTEFIIQLPL